MKTDSTRKPLLPSWVVGEFIGTFILVFFGCGAVCAAVITGAQVGLWQVAVVWGIGIALAIHLCGALSGAHINPSVTLAFALWGDFPVKRVVPYILLQLCGAFSASAVLYLIFAGHIAAFETLHGITRGAPGSEASAMVFGEYFPNPGAAPLTDAAREAMPAWRAFAAEVIGTALLVLAVFGLIDSRNSNEPGILAPALIGLTVSILISVLAPLTMACFNPARDLGPRLFSYFAGWGDWVFLANGHGWFSVYIAAPLLGGILGGALYTFLFKGLYEATSVQSSD